MSEDYDYLYKLVTLGDSGVGKTSVLNQFTYEHFSDHVPSTIGVEFFVKRIKIKAIKRVKLQVWDISGQQSFSTITRAYVRNIMGGILVFDLTSRESFENIPKWINMVIDAYPKNEYLQFVLVGNKNDLTPVVSDKEIKDLIDAYPDNICEYFSASAKTGSGIRDVFFDFATYIHDHNKSIGEPEKGRPVISLVNSRNDTDSECCAIL